MELVFGKAVANEFCEHVNVGIARVFTSAYNRMAAWPLAFPARVAIPIKVGKIYTVWVRGTAQG